LHLAEAKAASAPITWEELTDLVAFRTSPEREEELVDRILRK
jgi:hypothetical protein